MAPQHSPRFLAIVQDAKTRIRETTVDEVKARLDRGEKPIIIDVREGLASWVIFTTYECAAGAVTLDPWRLFIAVDLAWKHFAR